jgi:Putative cyclase
MPQRWKNRPEGSNWGEFGPDDQRGRMNLLTREKVLAGVAEAKEGLAFCLSLPLDLPGGNVVNPRRHPPRRAATIREDGQAAFNFPLRKLDPRHTDVACDDAVLLHLQYSTQWDSLAHIGSLFDADGDGVAEPVYYNGWRGGEHIAAPDRRGGPEPWAKFEGTAAKALGIENMAAACVQGRGVLIDLNAHYGRARQLVGYDDLMRVCQTDRVEVEAGDMVCLHTGFAELLVEMGGKPDGELLARSCATLDGRDKRLLRWVTESGLVALIADNYAVEELPAREPAPGEAAADRHAALPLHEHCLFKLGVHLGELWHLTELARWLRKARRSRFLLTAPPLRLPGAVGSPATPIATV